MANEKPKFYNLTSRNVVLIDGVIEYCKPITFGTSAIKKDGVFLLLRHYMPGRSVKYQSYKAYAFGPLKDAIVKNEFLITKKKCVCVGHLSQFGHNTGIVLDTLSAYGISAFGISESTSLPMQEIETPIDTNLDDDITDSAVDIEISEEDLPF